jgi:hypothetical protein
MRPRQVQDFIPTPMSDATTMYYTGVDPLTRTPVYTAKDLHEKRLQKALLLYWDPAHHDLTREALLKAGRRRPHRHGPALPRAADRGQRGPLHPPAAEGPEPPQHAPAATTVAGLRARGRLSLLRPAEGTILPHRYASVVRRHPVAGPRVVPPGETPGARPSYDGAV